MLGQPSVTDHWVELLHIHQVIPVDMLIDMESRQVRLSYCDKTEMKHIAMREEPDMLRGLEPPLGHSSKASAADVATSAVASSPAGVYTFQTRSDQDAYIRALQMGTQCCCIF